MFGINEILEKAFFKKPLTKEERIKILRSKRIDPKVIEYLIEKLDKLYIEVLGDCEGSLFQLMPIRKLEGWCWETTESAIVFLNDDDYVERGNIYPYESSKEGKIFERVMREIIGEAYDKIKEEKKDEVIVHAPEDVNTPLYRNGAGYKAEIENGKIKKLKVHFYYTDC